MTGLHKLERLTTRYLVSSTSVLLAVVFASVVSVFLFAPAHLDTVSKAVDIILKVGVAAIGGAWALNRYFMARTDELQLRVESDVQAIQAGSFKQSVDLGMLIVRLDIINTGKALIPSFQQRLVVDEVYPSAEGIEEVTLYSWPKTGLHPGGPIEPGSWSALNFAHPIPASTLAVRIYLEVYLDNTLKWTWHKTFQAQQGHVKNLA